MLYATLKNVSQAAGTLEEKQEKTTLLLNC
jgi:hypothetical protein